MAQKAHFTQAEVTRAIKAVTEIGLTPTRIEIDRKGTIALFFDEQAAPGDDIQQYIGPSRKRR